MFVAGIPLSSTTVAILVRCLQRDGYWRLADDLGLAVDGDRHEFALAPSEEREILAVLDECPAPLRELRQALRGRARRRSEDAA